MNRCEDGVDSINRRPFILNDVQTEGAVRIDVGMEHLSRESHAWWFLRVLFIESQP